MSKFAIVWELGGGLGHVARLKPVVHSLAERGHDVSVVTRKVPLCHRLLSRPGVTIYQAPVLPDASRKVRLPCTLTDILHSCGFAEPANLASVATAWRNLYQLLAPDVILFDHSPTALVAARDQPATRAIMGTGFTVPPNVSPLPSLRRSRPHPPWTAEVETTVLNSINATVRSWGGEPLAYVAQLYSEVDRQFLLTFPELDHYPTREGADYRRPIGEVDGRSPTWPAGGRRVFVYLKGHPSVPMILGSLQQAGHSVLCYSEGVPKDLQQKFAGTNVHVSGEPIDINLAAQESDVALHNGGHGVTCEFLLAGKPMMILPLALEQQVTGQRVVDLGAGLCGSLSSADAVAEGIQRLIREPSYQAAAEKFNRRYGHLDRNAVIEELVREMEHLAAARMEISELS